MRPSRSRAVFTNSSSSKPRVMSTPSATRINLTIFDFYSIGAYANSRRNNIRVLNANSAQTEHINIPLPHDKVIKIFSMPSKVFIPTLKPILLIIKINDILKV